MAFKNLPKMALLNKVCLEYCFFEQDVYQIRPICLKQCGWHFV